MSAEPRGRLGARCRGVRRVPPPRRLTIACRSPKREMPRPVGRGAGAWRGERRARYGAFDRFRPPCTHHALTDYSRSPRAHMQASGTDFGRTFEKDTKSGRQVAPPARQDRAVGGQCVQQPSVGSASRRTVSGRDDPLGRVANPALRNGELGVARPADSQLRHSMGLLVGRSARRSRAQQAWGRQHRR